MKHLKRAIPVVLALVMAFALSVTAWAAGPISTANPTGASVEYTIGADGNNPSLGSPNTLENIISAINTNNSNNGNKTVTVTSIKVTEKTHTLASTAAGVASAHVTVSGTADLTIKTATGAIEMSGGTLTIDDEGGNFTVTGTGGALVVKAGTVNASGTFASISVKGGTLNTESATAVTATGGVVHSTATDGYPELTVTGTNGTVCAYGTFQKAEVNGTAHLYLGYSSTSTAVTSETTILMNNEISVVSSGVLHVAGGNTIIKSTSTGNITITNGGTHTIYTENGATVTVGGTNTTPATVSVISTGSASNLSVGMYSNVTAGGVFDEVSIGSSTSSLTLAENANNGNITVNTTTSKILHNGGTLTIKDGGNNNIVSGGQDNNPPYELNLEGDNNTVSLTGTATVNVKGSGNTVNVTNGTNTVAVTSNSENTVNVSSDADTRVTSTYNTTKLTVSNSSGDHKATVSGQYQSVTLNSGNIQLNSGLTITAINNGNTVSFGTGEITATIAEGSTGSVTVTGDESDADNTLIVNGGTVNATKQFLAITVNGGKLTLDANAISEGAITLNGGTLTIASGTYKVFGGNSNTNEPGGDLTVITGIVCAYGKFNAVEVGVESGNGTLYLGYTDKPTNSANIKLYTSYTTVNGGLSVSGNGVVLACGNAENSTVTIRKSTPGAIVKIAGHGSVTLGNLVTVTGSVSGTDNVTLTGIEVASSGAGNDAYGLVMHKGSSIVLSNDSSSSTLQGIVNTGKADLSDVTITLDGKSSSDAAILNSNTLEIRASAGLDSSNSYAVTTSAPTAASVNVTTAMGSALKSTGGTVKVYGAYKAARFESQDPANPALVVSSGTADLRCGEFVGKTESVFNGFPKTNYYIDADGTTDTVYHQTVTDAVWAIQYFMGEAAGSAPTATSAQYVGGVYTLACDINLKEYGYKQDATNYGALANSSNENKTIQVAGVRTLNLDGYSITGATGYDVITKGSNATALTIQNTGKKGLATSAGTSASMITAQEGKNAIVLENGNVTVNVTTADIKINAAAKSAIKTANGTVTLTNDEAKARFITLGNVEGTSVSITNNSDGEDYGYPVGDPEYTVLNCAYFIYGDVKATGMQTGTGTVTINNRSAHGLVGIVNSVDAAGAMTVTNGQATGEFDGVVLIGNDVEANSLIVTNYSVGKDFTYKTDFENAAVVIGDDVGQTGDGFITIDNKANGGILIDDITAAGAVTVTNGTTTTTPATETTPAVTNYINTGYITLGTGTGGTPDGLNCASLTITNNAKPAKDAQDADIAGTGVITVNNKITATDANNNVVIRNNTDGTIAINIASGDDAIDAKGNIFITNGPEGNGEAPTAGAIAITDGKNIKSTAKSVVISNNSSKPLTIGAVSAAENVTVYNYGAGGMTITSITADGKTTDGSPAVMINNSKAKDNTASDIDIGDIVTTPVTGDGDGGAVEINNYVDETVTTGAITTSGKTTGNGGAVEISNPANGIVTTGEIKASGAGTGANGDVKITNGTAVVKDVAGDLNDPANYTYSGNGYVKVNGTITSGKLTITNNASVKMEGQVAVPNTGKIEVTGAVTTNVGADKTSTITNNANGTIEIKTDAESAITKSGLGTLTIDNTVEGGKITIKGGNYGVKMAADGTVNIGDGEYDDGIYVYGNQFGIGVIKGVLNVNGGEIENDYNADYAAIYQTNSTEVNISGGKIRGNYGLKSENGDITISGGEITGKVDAIQVLQSSSGTIKITNGKFTAETLYGLRQIGGTITEISGGTFIGGTNGYGYWRRENVVVAEGKNQHIISGGTFSSIKTEVADETLADLMVLDANKEPGYTFRDAGTGEGDAKVTATVGTRELYTLTSLTKDSTYTPYTILSNYTAPNTDTYAANFTVVPREWYEIAIHGAGGAIGATDSKIEVTGLEPGQYKWRADATGDTPVYKMLYIEYGIKTPVKLTLTAVNKVEGEETIPMLLQKVASRDTLTYVKGEPDATPAVNSGFVDANYYGTLVNTDTSTLTLEPIARGEDEYFTDYEIQVVSTEKRTLTVDIDDTKKDGTVEYKYVLDATHPEAIVNYSNPNEAAVVATERKDTETILVADGNFVELTFTPDSTESAHSVHSVALTTDGNGNLESDYTEPGTLVNTPVTKYYTAGTGDNTLNVEFCEYATTPTASATASSTSVTTGTTVTLTGAVTPKDAHLMPVKTHAWTKTDGTLQSDAAVTLTNENAEKATVKSTKAGTLTLTYTATLNDNTTQKAATVTITFTAPTSTGSVGGGSSTPTPTASLSGDDNSVSIGVSTSNGTATMSEPKAADLEKVIGTGVDTGEVVIDMSKLSGGIDTATIPTKTFDSIEAAVTDASNDAEKLTIKLPASSVTFNAAALDAIADQATGATISLEVSKRAVSSLAAAQRDAVKDLDVQDVYSITLTSGGKTISDFEGGSATVTVNYTLKAGQSARGIVVWYVANDGTLAEVPATFSNGKVTFTVSHFSNYVIAYDAARAEACPQDDTCPMAAFSDADPKAWYHEGVHWAIENGVMSGMGNGIFAPNGTTTRAMVVQILWNIEGNPAYVGMSEYADVDNEAWFGPAVRWASAEGIVEGYANPDGAGSIFKPNTAVTREQLATILYRYAQYKGYDVSVGEDTNILSYEDAFSVSDWAMAAMQWACGAGVIQGSEVGNTIYLLPKNNATRAQVATMIARFCTQVAK